MQGKLCYVCKTSSCREMCVMYATLLRAGKVCYVCNTSSLREMCVMYATLFRAGKGVLCMHY